MAFGMVADLFMKPNLMLMGSRTVYPVAWLLLMMMSGAQRFGVRLVNQIGVKNRALKKEGCSRVMVVGAGWAGASLIRELNARGFREGLPVVAVDDDPAKANTRIMGIPVLKGIENIPRVRGEVPDQRDRDRDPVRLAFPAQADSGHLHPDQLQAETGAHPPGRDRARPRRSARPGTSTLRTFCAARRCAWTWGRSPPTSRTAWCW